MNHIYKVIWSKAKHAYVVTSEVAKSHTKGTSAKAVKTALAAAVGMSLFVGGIQRMRHRQQIRLVLAMAWLLAQAAARRKRKM